MFASHNLIVQDKLAMFFFYFLIDKRKSSGKECCSARTTLCKEKCKQFYNLIFYINNITNLN